MVCENEKPEVLFFVSLPLILLDTTWMKKIKRSLSVSFIYLRLYDKQARFIQTRPATMLKSVEENSITSGSKTKSLTTRTLERTDEEDASDDAEAENLFTNIKLNIVKNFIDWPVDSAQCDSWLFAIQKKPHLGLI